MFAKKLLPGRFHSPLPALDSFGRLLAVLYKKRRLPPGFSTRYTSPKALPKSEI